jgi:hypothetical protein
MALDNDNVKQLIQQLEADRQAYLSSHNKLQEALVHILSGQHAQPDNFTPHFGRTLSVESAEDPAVPRKPSSFTSKRTNSIGLDSSERTLVSRKSWGVDEAGRKVLSLYSQDDSSDSDDDESFYASEHLPHEVYSEDDLRQHIRNYQWGQHARLIFGPLQRSNKLSSADGLFACDPANLNDANHTTADVYEVGEDGAPLKRSRADVSNGDKATWEALCNVNADPSRRQAVGRIVLLREPTSLLYGALHLTMNSHFDMDSIYRMLIDDQQRTRAYTKGHQDTDNRRQRSIVFCFKYHTIVGEGREPLLWQNHDDDTSTKEGNIPISTCSSVVALSLAGPPEKTFRRHSRRTKTPEISHAYDPFAPWHVLSLQNFPDWHSEVNLHETSHHYVNGPDAFLVTLLHEYRDAATRLKELAAAITNLTKPPQRAIFDAPFRDELIFESGDFVFTRRYFWASQTLGVLAEEIERIIAAYRDTFTDEVWSGEHRTLFPGKADKSARFANWRKKMLHTRKLFEHEVDKLKEILRFINREQKEIKSLREWLFSGTSVAESRQAVKQALITVEQGYNIKLLTLVTIFFLPLMFVTSVFGMTNMPVDDDFVPAIVMALAICLPTYLLIAVINSPEKFQKGVAWLLWPWVLLWTWTRQSWIWTKASWIWTKEASRKTDEYVRGSYSKYYKEKYLSKKKLKQGEKAARRSGWSAFMGGGGTGGSAGQGGRGWGRQATFATLEARLEAEGRMGTGRRASRPFNTPFPQPADAVLDVERDPVRVGKYDGTSVPATLGGAAKPTPLPTALGQSSSRGVAGVFARPAGPLQRESTVRFDTDSFRPNQERRVMRAETPEPSPNASVGNLDEVLKQSARAGDKDAGRIAGQSVEPSNDEAAATGGVAEAGGGGDEQDVVGLRLATTRVPTIQITGDPESPTVMRTQRPSLLRRISSKLGNNGEAASKGGQP